MTSERGTTEDAISGFDDQRPPVETRDDSISRSRLLRTLVGIPLAILLTFGVIFFIFALQGSQLDSYIAFNRIGAEEAAQLAEDTNLDDPYPQRYARFVGNVASGDLGTSRKGMPVTSLLLDAIPVSALLALLSMSIAFGLARFLSVASMRVPGSATDRMLTATAIAFGSTPTQFIALLLLVCFAAWLRWFPVGGLLDPDTPASFGNLLEHLVLPCTTLVVLLGSRYFLIMRTHLRAAFAGEQDQRLGLVQRRHLWRLRRQPIVGDVLRTAGLVACSLIAVEYTFSIEGIGWLFYESVRGMDLSVLIGTLLVFTFASTLATACSGILQHAPTHGKHLTRLRNKAAILGLAITALYVLFAVLGPLLISLEGASESVAANNNQPQMMEPSWLLSDEDTADLASQQAGISEANRTDYESITTWQYPLGTDDSGRSLLPLALVEVRSTLWLVALALGVGMFTAWILAFLARIGRHMRTTILWLTDYAIGLPIAIILIGLAMGGDSPTLWPWLGLLIWPFMVRPFIALADARKGTPSERPSAVRAACAAVLIAAATAVFMLTIVANIIEFSGGIESVFANAVSSGATLLGASWYVGTGILVPVGLIVGLTLLAHGLTSTDLHPPRTAARHTPDTDPDPDPDPSLGLTSESERGTRAGTGFP